MGQICTPTHVRFLYFFQLDQSSDSLHGSDFDGSDYITDDDDDDYDDDDDGDDDDERNDERNIDDDEKNDDGND